MLMLIAGAAVSILVDRLVKPFLPQRLTFKLTIVLMTAIVAIAAIAGVLTWVSEGIQPQYSPSFAPIRTLLCRIMQTDLRKHRLRDTLVYSFNTQ